ncbi:MAG TPA: M81 family metallopeptidase [Ensifer sp.]|uniref:M81 family metallopeptidase n=1 Tax=Ensifer sp. TaxID=1872086 RepID=UPI002E122F5B|nr:M81 family metallopeptidase [Ensifer sp.]
MSPRVAVLEFNQETNTFSKLTTGFRDFEACHYFLGAEIETHCRGTNSEIGGFIDCCDRYGWQPVYTVAARAEPGGRIEEAMRLRFVADLTSALAGQTLDGVFIVFHGAMCTETADDAQVQLLEAVRGIVGTKVPIAATFDLHANSAPEMAGLLDIAVSFRTYPHVDMAECAHKAGALLERAMRGEIRPAIAIRQPPMVNGCNDGRTTHACAMTELLEIADAIASRDGMLATSINAGFYDADIFNTGPSAVICYDRNRVAADDAEAEAERLCREIWDRRAHQDVQLPLDALPGIVKAHLDAERNGPLVIADFSDNPGCGAYSDSTCVLRGLLDIGVSNVAFGALCDPAVAAELIAAGVGANREVTLGCKIDPAVGGGPISVRGTVEAISDGRIVFEGPMFQGLSATMGPSVRFHVDGIDILICSERQQMLDRNLLRAVGIEPSDYAIVVVKSQQHFRAAFGPIASAIVEIDGTGLSSANIGARNFQRVRRPVYPLDLG